MNIADNYCEKIGNKPNKVGTEMERIIVFEDGSKLQLLSQPIFLLGKTRTISETPTSGFWKPDHFTGLVYEAIDGHQLSCLKTQWNIEAQRMIQFMNELNTIDLRTTLRALFCMVKKKKIPEDLAEEVHRIRHKLGEVLVMKILESPLQQ